MLRYVATVILKTAKKAKYPQVPCAFNKIDLGIAIGSVVSKAAVQKVRLTTPRGACKANFCTVSYNTLTVIGGRKTMSSNILPWDCADTFGKKAFQNDPGQAHLQQWPLKLKMISPVAPYFHKAHIMLAADCAGFSYRNFHKSLLRDRILIIGCPELDGKEFDEKLLSILKSNEILSIAVARMDAPCCGKLATSVIDAIRKSRKDIPLQITNGIYRGRNCRLIKLIKMSRCDPTGFPV